MDTLKTLTYDVTGRIARITLNRPERGNGITFEMLAELAACVERANLDPSVHVIALSGNGKGFCGGYDLVLFAEQKLDGEDQRTAVGSQKSEVSDQKSEVTDRKSDVTDRKSEMGEHATWPAGSPLDPKVQLANHDPEQTWDPMLDYAMMSRNVRAFMSLFTSDKPVLCKVHGFCVAGGTDMALCSDLLFIEETATIGYPPARAWGVPTTALWAYRIGPEKAKRLLFTGDCLTGKQAAEWGLATEAVSADRLDERFERMLERVARLPVNQLVMMKLLINQTLLGQGLQTSQLLGTLFDGVARHTKEGYAFQRRAAEVGFKQAVKERDEPFREPGQ